MAEQGVRSNDPKKIARRDPAPVPLSFLKWWMSKEICQVWSRNQPTETEPQRDGAPLT